MCSKGEGLVEGLDAVGIQDHTLIQRDRIQDHHTNERSDVTHHWSLGVLVAVGSVVAVD